MYVSVWLSVQRFSNNHSASAVCTVDDITFSVSECQASDVRYSVAFFWRHPKTCSGGVSLPSPLREPCGACGVLSFTACTVSCSTVLLTVICADFVPWGSKTSVGVATFVGLTLVLIVAIMVWLIKKRQHPVVRYMQPTFCWVFVSAAFLSNVSALTMMVTRSGATTSPPVCLSCAACRVQTQIRCASCASGASTYPQP